MSAYTSSVNQDGVRIYKNTNSVDIPQVDLPTLLFGECIATGLQRAFELICLDTEHGIAEDDTKLHVLASNPNIFLTKKTLRALAERIAHFLRNTYSVGATGPYKDVVVVCSSGQPAAAAAFYGIIAAGGVFSAASPSFTPEELARQIRQGKSKVLIVSPDKIDVGTKAAQLVGLPLDRVIVLNSDPGFEVRSLEGGKKVDVQNGPRLPWRRVTDPEELKKSLIVLLYSSGTTGVPKGMFPNKNINKTCSHKQVSCFLMRTW
jgi:acyl-coenzyme A synthetase/AMP-(fatty) acid ligase